MADKKKEILSRHLREVKAKRKSKSFSTLVNRLRLEQEFRNLLVALREEGIFSQEVLPSLLPVEEIERTPDFILWKHNIKMPIFLIPHENGNIISRNTLRDYLIFLMETDYEVVAGVWMSLPSFPCRIFRIIDIERKLRNEGETFVIENLSAFKPCIVEFFSERAPIWPVPRYEKIPALEKPELVSEAFESKFREVVKREAKRRTPRLPHRKKAIRDISDEDLNKICTAS